MVILPTWRYDLLGQYCLYRPYSCICAKVVEEKEQLGIRWNHHFEGMLLARKLSKKSPQLRKRNCFFLEHSDCKRDSISWINFQICQFQFERQLLSILSFHGERLASISHQLVSCAGSVRIAPPLSLCGEALQSLKTNSAPSCEMDGPYLCWGKLSI